MCEYEKKQKRNTEGCSLTLLRNKLISVFLLALFLITQPCDRSAVFSGEMPMSQAMSQALNTEVILCLETNIYLFEPVYDKKGLLTFKSEIYLFY